MSTRYPNPFCAARFAPGVLAWIGELDPLVDRICMPGARLQVLGPHGSGKSTLLVHLARRAAMRGWETISFRGSQGLPSPLGWKKDELVVFADEAEELGAARLLALRILCAARGASLVVTAHRHLGFETLCTRAVDAPLVRELVHRLLDGAHEEAPSIAKVDELLRRHEGNVREVFFELYDAVASHGHGQRSLAATARVSA